MRPRCGGQFGTSVVETMKVNFSSLAFRIPLFAFLTAVTIAGAISFLSYMGASKAFEREAGTRLAEVVESRAKGVEAWFTRQLTDIALLRDDPTTVTALKDLDAGWDAIPNDPAAALRKFYVDQNPHPVEQKGNLVAAADGSAWTEAHSLLHPYFRDLQEKRGYHDAFLIDAKGDVLYSGNKGPEFATNILTGPLAKSGLAAAYRKAMDQADGAPVFEDFSRYEPAQGAPVAFMAARVNKPDGNPYGVLAVEIPTERLEALVHDSAGLGNSGHIVLLGTDGLRRSTPPEGQKGGILDPMPKSADVLAAMAGKSGTDLHGAGLDDGAPAISSYHPLDVAGAHWAIRGEEDRAELMADAVQLRNRSLLVMGVAAALALLLGRVVSQSIVRPLTTVSAAMDRIAAQDYDFEVPYRERHDEMGAIAENLEGFRAKLKANEADAKMALFKSRAFSTASAAMMVADRELNIVDYNEALKKLFHDNLSELKQKFPDFDPDRLIGVNIDKFHRDPGHQRRLLADPKNLPLVTDIRVGEAFIQLNIEAIYDDEGHYVGAGLQWRDVRDERVNSGIMEAIRRNQTMAEYDCEFRLIKVNQKFSEIFGWAEDAYGMTFERLFGPTEDTRIGMERLKGGLTVTRKVERRSKAGAQVWVEVVMNPIFNRQGKLDRIVEIGTDVTRMERGRQKAEAEARTQAEAQRRVVDELSRGLSALADGDLSVALNTAFSEEYEQVRGDFNIARERLHEVVTQLQGAIGSINDGAGRIAQASEDLSRRTESQAATLEETSAALDELSQSVRATASSAGEADKAVRAARSHAEASGLVVAKAVEAMGEIQKSSSQIAQIVGLIDNIAFQTNLLALNAGVEAARAGESGRGFAVVASEVRELAQRSSEAAKQIESLITASTGHVNQGVRLVGETGEALESILTSVSHISSLVSGIASAQEEQSTGISEISIGANALAEVTQKNSAMVDQATAEGQALRSEAGSLAKLASRFKLDADHQSGEGHDDRQREAKLRVV